MSKSFTDEFVIWEVEVSHSYSIAKGSFQKAKLLQISKQTRQFD